MKNIVISSILALAVIAFSGCSVKSGCNAPKLPTCAPAVSAPCGCHK